MRLFKHLLTPRDTSINSTFIVCVSFVHFCASLPYHLPDRNLWTQQPSISRYEHNSDARCAHFRLRTLRICALPSWCSLQGARDTTEPYFGIRSYYQHQSLVHGQCIFVRLVPSFERPSTRMFWTKGSHKSGTKVSPHLAIRIQFQRVCAHLPPSLLDKELWTR